MAPRHVSLIHPIIKNPKENFRSYTYGVARGMAMKFGSALTRLGGKRGDVMGMVSDVQR